MLRKKRSIKINKKNKFSSMKIELSLSVITYGLEDGHKTSKTY